METKAYYSVVRIVPDPTREEFLNFGVILTTRQRVMTRFTKKYTRIKRLYPAVDEKRLRAIEKTWPKWLEQELGIPLLGEPLSSLKTLSESMQYQTQLSDPRRVEIKEDNVGDFAIEQILIELFEQFVEAPRFRSKKKAKQRRKVRTIIRKELRQLDLLHAVHEDSWVKGTTAHPVTFTYQNGREVAIDAIDIHFASSKKDRANLIDSTYGKWADIERSRKDEIEPISVLPNMRTNDFAEIVNYLESVSTVYVVPEQIESLRNKFIVDIPHQKDLTSPNVIDSPEVINND